MSREGEEAGTGKGGAGRPVGGFLVVFLCIYFFLPILFIWPVEKIYGETGPFPRAYGYFILPIDLIAMTVPPYHALLLAEMRWSGLIP